MSLLRRLADLARSHLQVPESSPGPGCGAEPAFEPGPTFESGSTFESGPTFESGTAGTADPQLAGYYANLELPYGATLPQVRSAWRRLMKQYHPDLHSRDPDKRKVADELTARLTDAYRQLEAALSDSG